MLQIAIHSGKITCEVMMDLDQLSQFVASNNSDTNFSDLIRKAFDQRQLKLNQKCVELDSKAEFIENAIRHGLNWIETKCQQGIELVTVDSSNSFYSGLQNATELYSKKNPLDSVFIGGQTWFVKLELDEWLKTIRQLYGIKIDVIKCKPGSTSDYYPNQIFNYELLNYENIN